MALVDRAQWEQQITDLLGGLTERVRGTEQQLTALTTALREVRENTVTQQQFEALERLLEQVSFQESKSESDSSGRNESDSNGMIEVEGALNELVEALDVNKLSDASDSIRRSAALLAKTTTMASERLEAIARRVETTQRSNLSAVQDAKTAAVKGIEEAASTAADVANQRLDAANATAGRLIEHAERLRKPLGWSVAANLALVLLPVVTVLLMGVMTAWTLVKGIQWVFVMDAALWLRIIAGVALVSLLAGSAWGLWKLVVWVRGVLERMRLEG